MTYRWEKLDRDGERWKLGPYRVELEEVGGGYTWKVLGPGPVLLTQAWGLNRAKRWVEERVTRAEARAGGYDEDVERDGRRTRDQEDV